MKIMVQGTSSSCGKTTVVTAMCRVFYQDGFKVCPFKSQNMSHNSYIDDDGLEMAWAQALQAFSAKIKPKAYMNPLLLKPMGDYSSKVIFLGKTLENMSSDEYFKFKSSVRTKIEEIFNKIEKEYDIIIIEGAGSPAEINLKHNDIVNMGMAKIANSNVILVADIDRGGAFASIYGTYMLLEESERARIKGIIINKFHGKKSLLESGIKELEKLINVPVIGVMPFIDLNISDEDNLSKNFKLNRETKINKDSITIVVINLPKIKNFNDYVPLMFEKDASVIFSQDPYDLKLADIVIIPDTEDIVESLNWLKKKNFWENLKYFKGLVIGIGKGYGIMSREIIISSSNNVNGNSTIYRGLGIFESSAFIDESQKSAKVTGEALGIKISGYLKQNVKNNNEKNHFAVLYNLNEADKKLYDGEIKENRYFGTNIRGLFNSKELKRYFFNRIKNKKESLEKNSQFFDELLEIEINKLADVFRENVDINYIYKIMKEEK